MDIHIGKINQTENGKGKAHLTYHIPIDTPKPGIVPTPVSSLSGLEQTEVDALAAGTLVEVSKDIIVEANQEQAEIIAAIKTNWQNVRVDYNERYNFEYKFYGVTIDVTP